MKHRIALLAFMATGAFVVTAGARQFDMTDRPNATAYRIDRLGPLGGPNLRGNSINDTGLVAGFADREGGQSRRAIAWSHRQPLDLGTLGGPNSSVALAADMQPSDIRSLARLYDYDRGLPLDAKETRLFETNGVTAYDVSYVSPKGRPCHRVSGSSTRKRSVPCCALRALGSG